MTDQPEPLPMTPETRQENDMCACGHSLYEQHTRSQHCHGCDGDCPYVRPWPGYESQPALQAAAVEPLPTVPESAPRECMDIGPVRFFRCELPIGHEGLHMGGPHEWRRDATGHMDYAGPRVKESTWIAPRPVPETAARIGDLANSTNGIIRSTSLPPNAYEPPAPPAEPVEEAQRCACGCTTRVNCYCVGHRHMEVEDEGARPLNDGAFAHRDYRDANGYTWSVNYPDGKGFPAWVPDEVEAAIRKEATAYEAQVSVGVRSHRDSLIASLDIESRLKDEWRTRAEAAEGKIERMLELDQLRFDALQAAEGALREAREALTEFLAAAARFGGDDPPTEAAEAMDVAIARLERAITAESVTPTGGDQ